MHQQTAESPDVILARLQTQLCDPILRSAFSMLDDAQKSALMVGALLMVSTAPPRVALLAGVENDPIDLGGYDLPDAAGDILAAFFTAGLANLAARQRVIVSAALESKRAQLMVALRPDRGEARCYLVADTHQPVLLFTLLAQSEQKWH